MGAREAKGRAPDMCFGRLMGKPHPCRVHPAAGSFHAYNTLSRQRDAAR